MVLLSCFNNKQRTSFRIALGLWVFLILRLLRQKNYGGYILLNKKIIIVIFSCYRTD